jgi:hypothetical protein
MWEIYWWWSWKKIMTSAQIKKMQKKMKKSYKKADKIREKMNKIALTEEQEAEKLLDDLLT